MNIPERPSGQIHVSTLRGRRGVLRMTGRIETGTMTLERARLQLTGGDTERCEQDLEFAADPRRTRDGHRYRYRLTLPWRQLWADGRAPAHGTLDACVLLDIAGDPEPVRVRVGMTPYAARQLTGVALSRHLQGRLAQGLYHKWRRSRFYFPHMRVLMWVVRRFPADAGRIVFEAGLGRQYADSPRYIYEELVRRGHPGRKVWSYRGTVHSDDPHTSTVQRLSVRYFWHLARAKYWVSSQNMPYYVTRRRDGVFVQTWHGTPLKRMLRDVAEVYGRDEGYVGRMTRAAAQWTVLVSPSAFATGAISGAYGFTGPVLEVGYPRNDLLAAPGRDERAAAVRARLGIPADARVVLYAPTFRDDRSYGRGRFGFALPFDPARLTQRLGRDVVVLLRLHLLVSDELEIPEAIESTVRDVSAYPEIQELQLASDVLVTDYSSVLFDYAILRRPMVFHAYDLDDYRDRLRGFYLDYEREMPGPITTSEDELLDVLADVVADPPAAQAQWAERLAAFVARFAPHDDGGAAARVVDAVFGPSR